MENGVKILDEHTQDFNNIDLTKIKGAYCIVIFDDGSTYMEVMNIIQIKKAWSKGYGYKENGGVHGDFTDMMAKKTVTSRACKQIVQQYGDTYAVESLDRAEELEDVDIVSEDVKYDIETKANTQDFQEAEFKEVVTESEVVEETKADDTPEWAK
jgi:recombination protein RecT